jgi:hypothetical protein
MALDFGTAAQNRYVDHGTLGSWNPSAGGFLVWMYPTDLTRNQDSIVIGKTGTAWGQGCDVMMEWGTDQIRFIRKRATLSTQIQSSIPFFGSANTWYCIAISFDTGGADSDQKLFLGDLTTKLAEDSYTARAVGSGSLQDLSSRPLRAGAGTWSNTNYAGSIALIRVYNTAPTLAQFLADQYKLSVTPNSHLVFCNYGLISTGTQPDWSGNGYNGTVTSALLAPHVPLSFPWVGGAPAEAPQVSGEVVWGHDTGVLEANVRDFSGNWSGTGSISGSGDAEEICLSPTEYMNSEVVYTGPYTVQLLQNNYAAGDTIVLEYRHGATKIACEAAAWGAYVAPFTSLGYVQVRVEATT